MRSHPDWLARAALHAVHRGKQKYRRDREDNALKLLRQAVDMAHASGSGQGHTSRRTLLERIYGPERIRSDQDVANMWNSARRWARDLRRAGLLELVEDQEPGTGMDCALRWRLLDPLVDSADPAGVAQSVRAAES